MKVTLIIAALLTATMSIEQPGRDDYSKHSRRRSAARNKGEATAYSRYFATDGTFTNLVGMFFMGRDAFRERHDQRFKGASRGSTKRVVRPDVAIVATLPTVAGFQKLLPGTSADEKGAAADSAIAGAGKGRRQMEHRDLSQCGREATHPGAGASIEFASRASLHEESVDTDCLHSIPGRISTEHGVGEDGKEAGYTRRTNLGDSFRVSWVLNRYQRERPS